MAAELARSGNQPIYRPLGRGSTPPRGPDSLRKLFHRRSPPAGSVHTPWSPFTGDGMLDRQALPSGGVSVRRQRDPP